MSVKVFFIGTLSKLSFFVTGDFEGSEVSDGEQSQVCFLLHLVSLNVQCVSVHDYLNQTTGANSKHE